MGRIQFESLCRYKYRLLADLVLQCSVQGFYLRTEYIELRADGGLTLRKGYAWDGPSGPTIDTASSLRGSAGHDALYQLINLRAIPPDKRVLADIDLRRWCIEDGMLELRANAWYNAVRAFGGAHI